MEEYVIRIPTLQKNPMVKLPKQVREMILEYLDQSDLCNLKLACISFHRICTSFEIGKHNPEILKVWHYCSILFTKDPLDVLPLEIVSQIFSYLWRRDLKCILFVSRHAMRAFLIHEENGGGTL